MPTLMRIEIENLKCGGCQKAITSGLSAIEGVKSIVIDDATSTVSVVGDEALRPAIISKLESMGYPEKGSVNGLAAGLATAKSYVSCAIGRIS